MSDINKKFEEVEDMPDGLQFFTYEEAAIILKVKRGTIRSWVYRGDIRSSVKMGKKSLIPKSELQRFVAKRTRVKTRPGQIKPAPVPQESEVVSQPLQNVEA